MATTKKIERKDSDMCYSKLEIIADNYKGLNDLNDIISRFISFKKMEMKTDGNKVLIYDWDSELTEQGKQELATDGTDDTCHAKDLIMTDEKGNINFRMLTINYPSDSSLNAFSKLAKRYATLNFVRYTQSNASRSWNEDTCEAYTKIYTYKKGVKQPNENDIMSVLYDFDF